MSISENTIKAALWGTDFRNEMPEITPAMLTAGTDAYCRAEAAAGSAGDLDETVRAIFTAMWKARRSAPEYIE